MLAILISQKTKYFNFVKKKIVLFLKELLHGRSQRVANIMNKNGAATQVQR